MFKRLKLSHRSLLLCHRSRIHYRRRGQRRRRHLHVLASGRQVRIFAAVDTAANHPAADRDAGNVFADGRGHGKGLSDLIREEFGLRTTFFLMALLLLANLTNVMANFAGVASSLGLFSVSKYISVPITAAGVWFLILKTGLPAHREGLSVSPARCTSAISSPAFWSSRTGRKPRSTASGLC